MEHLFILLILSVTECEFPMLIGGKRPTAWPPNSPELMPLSFFCWGYAKDWVYSQRVNKLDELKSADNCSKCRCYKEHVTAHLAKGGL
jgi:hypothetical protein